MVVYHWFRYLAFVVLLGCVGCPKHLGPAMVAAGVLTGDGSTSTIPIQTVAVTGNSHVGVVGVLVGGLCVGVAGGVVLVIWLIKHHRRTVEGIVGVVR